MRLSAGLPFLTPCRLLCTRLVVLLSPGYMSCKLLLEQYSHAPSCTLRRAPPRPLAALLSPILWRLNSPDRFDMYSTGITFLQLVFTPLQSDNGLAAFNKCAQPT